MPNYRRAYSPGSSIFLTLVTYNRTPIFRHPENVQRLRWAITLMKTNMAVEITAAVILPDHIHFIWKLPQGDSNYSKRVGRLKVLFTQSLQGKHVLPNDVSLSRQKHQESNVWQRRFWEHTTRDEADWIRHLNYLHYNPVKHKLVGCPHQWEYSSFHRYVSEGYYPENWGCQCEGRMVESVFVDDSLQVGE